MMNKYLTLENYIRYGVKKCLKIVSPALRLWENKYLERYGDVPLKHQPVFIIGAPRTGSTILYEVITNQLDVLYIDNLICKFYRNLFFGFWLSNKLFEQRPHNCFESNYGNTEMCGLHAPSECGNFWYRWLPQDRHFIDFDDITDKMVDEIRKEITAVSNYFEKPIVFKNLNAGQRLRLLKKCLPNAKFIFIKREPIFTAQSLLKAKRKLGLKDNEFWSIMPKNVDKLRKLNGYEQIVKQIFYLEKQIMEDKHFFEESQFLILEYKNFIKNLDSIVSLCRNFIGVGQRIQYEKPEIRLREKFTLSLVEIDRLKIEIDKLDWEYYTVPEENDTIN